MVNVGGIGDALEKERMVWGMATLCKNCGRPLQYDPLSKRVVCRTCGSAFAAENVEAYGKKYEEERSESPAYDPDTGMPVDPNSGAVKEFLECHIYTCNTCGGEIVLNGAEMATTCIYCGGPSIVFNRISKEKRPDFIVPFQLSREQVMMILHQRFRGMFIPDEFKHISPEMIRGIYIPYWLVNAYHSESDIIMSREKEGDHNRTYYYARAGSMKLENYPVEASALLNDESSSRLDPFDYSKLTYFDEDYLLGFYANTSDITFGDLRKTVDDQAKYLFQYKATQTIRRVSLKKVEQFRSATLVDKDLKLALLPVWFVTIMYKGQPHTILVNGSTGKVVCGIPWSEKKFWLYVTLISAVLSIIPSLICALMVYGALDTGSLLSLSVLVGLIPTAMPFLLATAAFFICALITYKKVTKQIQRTQDSRTFNFVNKRQG